MKPIFHVCGDSRNYGDQAIVLGLRRLIRGAYRNPITWLSFDFKQAHQIDETLVDYINKHCSCMIIGGGGMFMPGDGFKSASGWQLNISAKLLSSISVPIIVFAIGYNHFPYDRSAMPKAAQVHIRKLRHHSKRFAVRDEGSLREFAQMGLKWMKVVPDPAIYAQTAPGLLPAGRRYIGFSWAGDRASSRFKAKEQLLFQNRVRRALNMFCQETGHALVYLPHVSRYDLDAPQIFGAHDGKTRFDLARVAPWMYPERSDNVPALIGTYGQCDLVLGMRGHSNIFSFAQGIPFIALGDHPKNTYFAESVGAPVVFNDCTNLLQVLKDTLADSELINKQNALRHESRLTLEAFAKECIRVILRETS